MNTIRYAHRVQYYETDQMQCVHHSNYIRWFEEARSVLMEALGYGYDVMEAAGVLCPVTEARAAYKSMARFGETAEIEATVATYTGVRITFSYVVRDKATKAVRCTGETHHCFTLPTGRPVALKKHLPALDAIMRQAMAGTAERE